MLRVNTYSLKPFFADVSHEEKQDLSHVCVNRWSPDHIMYWINVQRYSFTAKVRKDTRVMHWNVKII